MAKLVFRMERPAFHMAELRSWMARRFRHISSLSFHAAKVSRHAWKVSCNLTVSPTDFAALQGGGGVNLKRKSTCTIGWLWNV